MPRKFILPPVAQDGQGKTKRCLSMWRCLEGMGGSVHGRLQMGDGVSVRGCDDRVKEEGGLSMG